MAAVMVFTKTDKLSKQKTADNIERIKSEMSKHWEELPMCFYTSAEKKTGREDVLDFIAESNKSFKKMS